MACVETERPGAGSSQIGDMSDGSKRMSDVAGKLADVGALGDGGGQGHSSSANADPFRRAGPSFRGMTNRRVRESSPGGLYLDLFAGARSGVGRLAVDLQR